MKNDGPILLSLDVDAAERPICDDKHSAIDLDTASLIGDTTGIEGLVVAVETELDVAQVASLVDVRAAYVVASDGMEIHGPGGLVLREAPRCSAQLPLQLRREIGASGLRLREDKYSVALYWCGVPYAAISPVADAFREWALGQNLEVRQAACGVEARCRGAGKGEALRWLTRSLRAVRVISTGGAGEEATAC
jgi:hypothetical protein